MSDFEYSSLSSDSSGDEVIVQSDKTKKNPNSKIVKVSKELCMHYSAMFIDTARLIDLFVKSENWTLRSFLEVFNRLHFHHIYAKLNTDEKQNTTTPHHFITITEDALGVAAKFLRSRSKKARVGAVYLLYILYKTQPLITTYPINIKMKPDDFKNTNELVDECLNEGLAFPAYCFYELDMKKQITISANTINVCLEANYPRTEVRKHMGRVADKHFEVMYEERKVLDPISKLQLMEQQMRNELAYVNKLSNLTLGHDAVPEYKPELSNTLLEIHMEELSVNNRQSTQNTKQSKVPRYKYKRNVAYPGKNENILDDMVITAEPSEQNAPTSSNCHPRKKLKMSRKKSGRDKEKSTASNVPAKEEHLLTQNSTLDLDSFDSDVDSDDYENTDDKYGAMIWRLLEQENDEFPTEEQYQSRNEDDE